MWGWEDVKMWRWAAVKMRRWEDVKMWRWEDVKMRKCEDEKMWGWEDVKMWRWDTDPHYWKNPALKRSREKCYDHDVPSIGFSIIMFLGLNPGQMASKNGSTPPMRFTSGTFLTEMFCSDVVGIRFGDGSTGDFTPSIGQFLWGNLCFKPTLRIPYSHTHPGQETGFKLKKDGWWWRCWWESYCGGVVQFKDCFAQPYASKSAEWKMTTLTSGAWIETAICSPSLRVRDFSCPWHMLQTTNEQSPVQKGANSLRFQALFLFHNPNSYYLKICFWNRTSTKSSKIHHAFFQFSNAKNMVISLLGTAGMNIQSGFPASDPSLKPWCRSSAPPLFLKLLGIIYIYIPVGPHKAVAEVSRIGHL